MITNVYINEIIAGAQRAAADYAYRISRQSLSGENPEALLLKLDVCINGATCLINNEGLTDHENQIIIDKLLIRGGIGNYGTTAITFSSITVSPATTLGNLTGMVTSVGAVTTVVTNANLTGPISSIGNATSITAQTGTTTVFAMQNSPTFTTDITTPLIIGGTAVGSKITYKSTTGVGTTTGIGHSFLGGNNGAVDIMRLYNDGTIGIGGPGSANVTLRLDKNITGAGVDGFGVYSNPTIQSGITNLVSMYASRPNTVASAFTLLNLRHFESTDVVIGAGSVVTNQVGVFVGALSSATNNYAFYSEVTAGTNRWGVYMSGDAVNYLAGNTGIGQTTFGTNATKTLALGNGVAPTTSPADAFQMYSADQIAGNAAAHFRTENGGIVKLYQETTGVTAATFVSNAGTAITSTDTFDGYTLAKVVKALRNQGFLA